MELGNVAADPGDVIQFIDSLSQCFDSVQQGLEDENNAIPLDCLEWKFESYFQVVQSMAVVLRRNNSDNQTTLMLEWFVEVMFSLIQNIVETTEERVF